VKVGVLTSGGDAPGMNAAIRAVVRAGEISGHEIYGVYDGYQGLIENKIKLLSHEDVSGLLSLGGTKLGTSRCPEFEQVEYRKKAIENLKASKIEALICIGGDGTYHGALELQKMGFNCIGLPGTIDNDIVGTDFTIGFHTALNTIVDAIDKLRDTSSSHQRCSIIEVMGRRAGDLALYSGICGGAEFIITRDAPIDKADIIKKLKIAKAKGRRHAIIVITEHILDVHALADEISEKSGFSTRATVLGYIQRGGSPVPEDRILGSRMGSYAIDLVNSGKFGVCVGVRDSRMVDLPFANVIDQSKSKDELYKLVKLIS
jgi:6-phosphofructokinase 1